MQCSAAWIQITPSPPYTSIICLEEVHITPSTEMSGVLARSPWQTRGRQRIPMERELNPSIPLEDST